MASKVRFVLMTVCAVLFLVAALGSRPGSGTTRSVADQPLPPPANLGVVEDAIAALRAQAPELSELGSWYATVTLHNENSGDDAQFRITRDGIVHPDDLDALTDFFACRRTGRRKQMNPGVLSMLVDLSQTFPDHTIQVISGYRARPYGVKHSKHFRGQAIDLRIAGVPLREVRNYVWTHNRLVGVGWYPHHGFVHMDYRPGEPEAAWTASDKSKRHRANPRWARRVRARALLQSKAGI